MPSKRASSASLPGSISNAAPSPVLPQIAPIRAVADQRLVADSETLLQAGDDRLAVGGVLLGLRLVAAHDVARAPDRHLLHEELGIPAAPLDQHRRERPLILQHHLADHRRAPFARAQDVV